MMIDYLVFTRWMLQETLKTFEGKQAMIKRKSDYYINYKCLFNL